MLLISMDKTNPQKSTAKEMTSKDCNAKLTYSVTVMKNGFAQSMTRANEWQTTGYSRPTKPFQNKSYSS